MKTTIDQYIFLQKLQKCRGIYFLKLPVRQEMLHVATRKEGVVGASLASKGDEIDMSKLRNELGF